MDRNEHADRCPDCDTGLNRREFMTAAAGATLAATTLPMLTASAAPTRKSSAESAVRRLYGTLSDAQRKTVALPYDDPRRHKVSANWHVTSAKIGSFDAEQQVIIKDVLKGVTSDDGYERFLRQMAEDNGGIEKYAIAIFGDPNEGPFEFELTGRHLTLRADGNSSGGAAFGGPIVYGHGKTGNAKANLFWYQTKRANEVFKALDGKQREKALLENAPKESAVQFRKDVKTLPGISCSELAGNQKDLVESVLKDIMQPYRKEDVDEVMEILKAGGGIDAVNIAFYQTDDLDDDKVWDIWRLESPNVVCHFRGAPHVHAYINIAKRS